MRTALVTSTRLEGLPLSTTILTEISPGDAVITTVFGDREVLKEDEREWTIISTAGQHAQQMALGRDGFFGALDAHFAVVAKVAGEELAPLVVRWKS